LICLRLLQGEYGGRGLVALEVAVAFWAVDDREAPRPFRREGIDDDIFDPIGVVT
jgi:hypothetical protein